MDDILLSVLRLPRYEFKRAKVSLKEISGNMILWAAVLSMPIVSIPYQLKAVRRAQTLRGVMPKGIMSQFRYLWRRPVFFIWTLHIEPIVIRNIIAIPLLFDALSIKGCQNDRDARWMGFKFEKSSFIYIFGVIANVFYFWYQRL